MKQIFKEKYSKLNSFNIPFYEGLSEGVEEIAFFKDLDAKIENGLKNVNFFWGDEAHELFKTQEGRERIFKTLNGLQTKIFQQ